MRSGKKKNWLLGASVVPLARIERAILSSRSIRVTRLTTGPKRRGSFLWEEVVIGQSDRLLKHIPTHICTELFQRTKKTPYILNNLISFRTISNGFEHF
jgi:hypothetical protein